MGANNSSLRGRRLCKLAHFLTVAFVVALIAYDFLHIDLSDFSLQKGQFKRIAMVAEAPKQTEAVERPFLPLARLSPAAAHFHRPSYRFQQKKEAQRTLSFRSKRFHIQRIVHPPPPASLLTSPA